jgi:hypothetical protein
LNPCALAAAGTTQRIQETSKVDNSRNLACVQEPINPGQDADEAGIKEITGTNSAADV